MPDSMNHSQDLFAVSIPLSAFNNIPSVQVAQIEQEKFFMPIPAYPDQEMRRFYHGLNLYRARTDINTHRTFIPQINLFLFTLENARFVLYPGLDGLILNEQDQVVTEPSCFCQHMLYKQAQRLPDMLVRDTLETVFLGFDAAWGNYYHWMLYGISKTQIAQSLFASEPVSLVVPDIEEVSKNRHLSFSKQVFETSLRLARLDNQVTRLKDGLYQAKKLHFFWHLPTMPELYLNLQEPHQHFDKIQVPYHPELPTRFYISREKSQNSRVTEEQQRVIDPVLNDMGFEKVFLETMDIETQIALFRQAKYIIAPHGAGLANLVFASAGTKILELNRPLDGQPHLRNCFYLIAARRKLPYMVVDLEQEKLTELRFIDMINKLDKVTPFYNPFEF